MAASVVDSDLFPATFDDIPVAGDSRQDKDGSKLTLRTYDKKTDSKGRQWCLEVSQDQQVGALEYEDIKSDSALSVVRYYNNNGRFTRQTLLIYSTYMQKALRACFETFPNVLLHADPVIMFGRPSCLFYYFDALEAYGRTLTDMTAVQHIVFLLRYVAHHFRSARTAYKSVINEIPVAASIDFENLWTVFRPKSLVLWKDGDDLSRLGKVKKVWMCECKDPKCSEHDSWNLNLSVIDLGLNSFVWKRVTVHVPSYDGVQKISSLSVLPLKYHPQRQAIFERLLKRGRTFLQLSKMHHQEYKGHLATMTSGVEEKLLLNLAHAQAVPAGRCIVDRAKYPKQPHGISKDNVDDDDDDDDGSLSPPNTGRVRYFNGEPLLEDDEIVTCVSTTPAFSLVNKHWFHAHVEKLTNVAFNEDAFNKLILPEKNKNLMKSLVQDFHTGGQHTFQDLIQGRGQGLVFLLYGAPGVGKTLTAEGIADLCKRPLYKICPGDLGLTPADCDCNLRTALSHAKRWRAIVLIDEAEAFLSARKVNEVDRSSLVSVFLRMLEYHNGLIFLTTNRIEDIDSAILSRVHLAIRYPEHTYEARQAIWRTFIERVADDTDDSLLESDTLRSLANVALNGRQIKNCVRMACAVARSNGRPVNMGDLDNAIRSITEFQQDFLGKMANSAQQSGPSNDVDESRSRKRPRLDEEEETPRLFAVAPLPKSGPRPTPGTS